LIQPRASAPQPTRERTRAAHPDGLRGRGVFVPISGLACLDGTFKQLPMYATLREYEGIKDPVEALRPLRDGLLAEMQALPGFIAYYFVDVGEAGDRMISLSVFASSEAAEASNRIAADWVERWFADHPNAAPLSSRVDAGPVVSSATA